MIAVCIFIIVNITGYNQLEKLMFCDPTTHWDHSNVLSNLVEKSRKLVVDTLLNKRVKVHGHDVREIMGYSFYLENGNTWHFGTRLHMVDSAE